MREDDKLCEPRGSQWVYCCQLSNGPKFNHQPLRKPGNFYRGTSTAGQRKQLLLVVIRSQIYDFRIRSAAHLAL